MKTMQERPIIIKYETNTDSKEQQAQRLDALNKQYNKMIIQKGYPYLFKQGK